jgi:hypothetical protein
MTTITTIKPPAGLTFCSVCNPFMLSAYPRIRHDDPTYEHEAPHYDAMLGDKQLTTVMDGSQEDGWYVRLKETETIAICPKCQKWPLVEVVHDDAIEFRPV